MLKGEWPAQGSLFGVVVNEAFARQAGGEVVGRRIGGSVLNDTIRGVVADFKARQLDVNPPPEVSLWSQRFPLFRSMRVLVRAASASGVMARSVRELLTQVDRTQPAYELETLEETLDNSICAATFPAFAARNLRGGGAIAGRDRDSRNDGVVCGTEDA